MKKLRVGTDALHTFRLVLLLGCLIFFVGCFSLLEKDAPVSFARSQRAPEIVLPDLSGQIRRLSDYRGQLVLVHFWASWCVPCYGEMRELQKLQQLLPANQFQLFLISIDNTPHTALEFLRRQQLSLPALIDMSGMATHRYGVQEIPASFLVDASGYLLSFQHTPDAVPLLALQGPQDWMSEGYLSLIRSIIDSN